MNIYLVFFQGYDQIILDLAISIWLTVGCISFDISFSMVLMPQLRSYCLKGQKKQREWSVNINFGKIFQTYFCKSGQSLSD